MAAFRFKLRTLHRLKIQLEDQAKNKLGLAVARENAEIAKLSRIKAKIADALDEFRSLSGGRFLAGNIKKYNYYVSNLKEKAAVQKTAVDEARKAVLSARAALVAAAQQREMYDKLKEKAFDRYSYEEKLAENLLVDGLVSYRGNLGAY